MDQDVNIFGRAHESIQRDRHAANRDEINSGLSEGDQQISEPEKVLVWGGHSWRV
jgi:hypothetical protein